MNTIPMQIGLLGLAILFSAWFMIVAENSQKQNDLRNQENVVMK